MRFSHRGRAVLNAVLALATVAAVLAAVLTYKSLTRPFQPAACQATADGTTFQVTFPLVRAATRSPAHAGARLAGTPGA